MADKPFHLHPGFQPVCYMGEFVLQLCQGKNLIPCNSVRASGGLFCWHEYLCFHCSIFSLWFYSWLLLYWKWFDKRV